MGSVKDLVVIKMPDNKKMGSGRFIFSDRYSVFDWGEMPNHIKNKGKALCITGAYFFERLEEMGIKTHYSGITENDKIKTLLEANALPDTINVKLLRVIRPEVRGEKYDYSIYKKEKSNFLIPLEVIYRNSLPEGSSVFKRLNKGEITPESLGMNRVPLPGERFSSPILDVSTKLEATDRYLTWKEAGELANLNNDEVEEIKKTTIQVNELISREVGRLGLFNEDGKMEFGFDENRNLILVDVIGTPDECRFTYNGIPVSKEVARIFYRNTEWYKNLEEAKKKDRVKWRHLISSTPPHLPSKLENLISFLYQSFCNELSEKKWFDSPPLKNVLYEIREVLKI